MEDKIRAMRFLLETESASGPFNLTAPNPVTGRDFGKALGKAMGKPSYLPVPAFAMDLAFGEVTTVVLAGQRAVPKKLKELGFNFTFDDVEKALLDLLNG
jgi:NAD dependent epimerase/dehydratase family enzyme